MDLIKAPLDFIGINLYTRAVVAHDSSDHYMGVKQVRPKADEVTEFGWEVYPQALSEMILHITKDYPGIPIYVTENGCSYGDGPTADGKVNDQRRVSFLRRFICEVGRGDEGRAPTCAVISCGRSPTTSNGPRAFSSASESCTAISRRSRGSSRKAGIGTRGWRGAGALDFDPVI